MNIMYKYMGIISVFAICIIVFSACGNNVDKNNEVAAVINGEEIYIQDIERVATETDTDEKDVLNDSINDLLIIQYGIENGIIISDEMVNERIIEVESGYPDMYNDIIESIGKEKYFNNLKYLMILEETKNYYIEKNMFEIKEGELKEWYKKYISKDMKGYEISKDSVYEAVFEEKEQNVILELIRELREKADIELYKEW